MKKVAIIGCGQIAEKVHAAYYRTHEKLVLAAVCDPDIQRAEIFAEKNGFQAAYQNACEMLKQEKPDIVSICTPNRFHYENVLLALRSGADVMCEKPPAMTPEQAEAMWQEAESQGAILAYDFHHRFSNGAQMLREQAETGRLGEIYMVKATALRRSGVPGWGNFIDKKAQGGGPLIDLGIHVLDAALYVLGFPKIRKVTAQSFRKIGNHKSAGTFGEWDPKRFTVEDALFGFIELVDGRLLQLETSFALNMKDEKKLDVAFYGDQAGATLYPPEIFTDDAGELVMLDQADDSKTDMHLNSMAAFTAAVFGEKRPDLATADQGYQVQRLVAALYESAEKGEQVFL
ncbi:Gfo/Idh/MocA family protein [Listeria ilorinensis]|uniref:Gfo/Idh/MocA family protein n=1 Tax=Listeria ilorinensis TaxID=2867439 RepID=UPI001EF575B3|nr:Gfo/Idh/MocA family oxidoreductase [Listeria ilorinensis]